MNRDRIRIGAVLMLLLMVVSVSAVSMAQTRGKPAMKLIRLMGWVVDDASGKRHANAESKEAVLAKFEDGSPLIFWTDDDRYYKIENADQAAPRAGQRWIVMGTIDENETIRIGSFIDPETRESQRAAPRKDGKVRPQSSDE